MFPVMRDQAGIAQGIANSETGEQRVADREKGEGAGIKPNSETGTARE